MPKQEQIACIFCGKSVVRERIDLSKYENWDVDWVVFQVREMLPGPGRGHKGKSDGKYGFPAIREEGLSILQMKDDAEYGEIVEAIRKRLIKIVKAYIKAGIIKRTELR